MHGDRITHFKYPNYEKGSLESYDWFRGVHGKPAAMVDDGWNLQAPIHAWYKDDEMQVVRYFNEQKSETKTYNGNVTNPYAGGDKRRGSVTNKDGSL